jgi:flagellin
MISLNTNMTSRWAAYSLTNTNTALQKSLNRLSSGHRINSSFDDAGGLAVSMKLSASIRRTEATQSNLNNAISSLQTQDGILKSAQSVLTRMSELAQLSADVTKSSSDAVLYQAEYNGLTSALVEFTAEQFNGTAMFSTDGATRSVVASEDGNQTIGMTQSNLAGVYVDNNLGSVDLTNISSITTTISNLETAIQDLSKLRASNGSEQMRLAFAVDMLSNNRNTIEAANSQIQDVDLATESSNQAKQSILNQTGMAMLSQANQSSRVVLRLLEPT